MKKELLYLLAASAGGLNSNLIPQVPRLSLSPNIHVHVDANSLFANWIAPGIETVGNLGATIKATGATSSNTAIPGQSWDDMRIRADDVDAAYVPGKTNVLITGETTNQIFNAGSTSAETIAKANQYIIDRKSAHPDWIILLVGTIPRADLPTEKMNIQANYKMLEVDKYQESNLQEIGVHGFVNVRKYAQEWYTLRSDGHTAAFMDSLSTCNSYDGKVADRVHPIGVPRETFSAAIADGLKRLPAKATY